MTDKVLISCRYSIYRRLHTNFDQIMPRLCVHLMNESFEMELR
jgi:hypothetical protein